MMVAWCWVVRGWVMVIGGIGRRRRMIGRDGMICCWHWRRWRRVVGCQEVCIGKLVGWACGTAGVTTQQPTGVDVEGVTVGSSTEEDETDWGVSGGKALSTFSKAAMRVWFALHLHSSAELSFLQEVDDLFQRSDDDFGPTVRGECTWIGMKRWHLCPWSIFVFAPSCTNILRFFRLVTRLLMYLNFFWTYKLIAMHTSRNLQFCRFRLTFQKWIIRRIDLPVGARDWKPRPNPVY